MSIITDPRPLLNRIFGKVDHLGVLEPMRDQEIAQNATSVTDPVEIDKDYYNLFFEQNAASARIVEVEYLNRKDTVVGSSTLIDATSGATNSVFDIKAISRRMRFRVTNNHTSSRTVRTITISPVGEPVETPINATLQGAFGKTNLGVVRFFENREVAIGATVVSEPFEVTSDYVNLSYNSSGTGNKTIKIQSVNRANAVLDEITVEENTTIAVLNQFKNIRINNRRIRVSVTNNHSSARTILSLDITPVDKVYDKENRDEFTRPKHTILSVNDISVGSNSTVQADNLWGSNNIYRDSSNNLYVAEFSFIYFRIEVLDGLNLSESYELEGDFGVRETAPSALRRSNFNSNIFTGNVDTISRTTFLQTGARSSHSDWIEVTGTHLRNLRLTNNDEVTRNFRLAIMGIR